MEFQIEMQTYRVWKTTTDSSSATLQTRKAGVEGKNIKYSGMKVSVR